MIQENKHILNSLDAYGIKHESKKLDFGDYSFRISDGITTENL